MKIFVATEEEKNALIPDKYKRDTIITGVGIINTLKVVQGNLYVLRNEKIVNVGYAGSHDIKPGTIWMIAENQMYQESEVKQGYRVLKTVKDVPIQRCLTASDFLSNTNRKDKFLVDMELAAYSNINNLYSIKVVSDNLDMEDYDKALQKDYKKEIQAILERIESQL